MNIKLDERTWNEQQRVDWDVSQRTCKIKGKFRFSIGKISIRYPLIFCINSAQSDGLKFHKERNWKGFLDKYPLYRPNDILNGYVEHATNISELYVTITNIFHFRVWSTILEIIAKWNCFLFWVPVISWPSLHRYFYKLL